MKKTMTREAWERRVARRETQCGGSFWNPDAVWREAFRRFPAAQRVSYTSSGTGLWQDVYLDGDSRPVTINS